MTSTRPPRLAVLRDFPEEGWPSMDLCAEMLVREMAHLRRRGDAVPDPVALSPAFRTRFGALPVLRCSGFARNADRLLNRMRHYPRFARARRGDFDLFHVCDHSYAQLVHELPADRTGVFCHDLDTFRCLLDPAADPRPRWFRAMMRRVLSGFQKAAIVFYTTRAVREQIERHGLFDPARLVRAPLGISDEFTPATAEASDNGGSPVETAASNPPLLLHVGSCIPRKRIDVLLAVFASVRRRWRDLRLVQVGGEWTPQQREQIDGLGIADAVTQKRGVARAALAGFYRRAAAVLLTSEGEGFGLPAVEALACGGIVLASDIPALREVGGEAVLYLPVGDVPRWAQTVSKVLDDPTGTAPPRELRLRRAAEFSWRRGTSGSWRLLSQRKA